MAWSRKTDRAQGVGYWTAFKSLELWWWGAERAVKSHAVSMWQNKFWSTYSSKKPQMLMLSIWCCERC